MQITDFLEVPYLPFFDFESNKGLCPLFKSPLFGVSSVFAHDFEKCAKLSNLVRYSGEYEPKIGQALVEWYSSGLFYHDTSTHL